MLYLLSTSCVLTLASSLLFPLGYATAAQFLPTRGSSLALPGLLGLLGIRLPVDIPVAPCSASESFYRIFVLRFRCIRHFVIIVINNIRIRFIISYSWYVLWYTVHSVVYTCDLILARIWLLGLCPFINRVLQSGIRAVSTVGWSLDRTGRVVGLLLSNPCLLKLFYYYTPWLLWLLPVLPCFLSLKNSFRRFWPESVIWPPWVLASDPFIIIR